MQDDSLKACNVASMSTNTIALLKYELNFLASNVKYDVFSRVFFGHFRSSKVNFMMFAYKNSPLKAESVLLLRPQL